MVVEARKGIKEVCFDQVPILFEEGRPETIWPGAGVVIHGKNGGTNLFERERSSQGSALRGCEGSGGYKGGQVKLIRRSDGGAKEIFKEIVEDCGFCRMGEDRITIQV
jgi:hypothetical protein